MKKKSYRNILGYLMLCLLLVISGCSSTSYYREEAVNLPTDKDLLEKNEAWKVKPVLVKRYKNRKGEKVLVEDVALRTGIFPAYYHMKYEDRPAPKANVLYLEGLADSMYNHDLLIGTLSKAGYRVISFDYPGQGGSKGSMNQTRIRPNKSGIVIEDMADQVWKELKDDPRFGIKSDEKIKAVIGWSTGGLAAYKMAKEQKEGVDAVVLIAPGTDTKTVFWIRNKTLNGDKNFVHIDDIQPKSPQAVPKFTFNLIGSGRNSKNWEVDSNVRGLVLLSDPSNDKYVKSEKVKETLYQNTGKNFTFVLYKGAYHEIDNQKDENRRGRDLTDEEVRDKKLKDIDPPAEGGELLENRVVRFLDKVFNEQILSGK